MIEIQICALIAFGMGVAYLIGNDLGYLRGQFEELGQEIEYNNWVLSELDSLQREIAAVTKNRLVQNQDTFDA